MEVERSSPSLGESRVGGRGTGLRLNYAIVIVADADNERPDGEIKKCSKISERLCVCVFFFVQE